MTSAKSPLRRGLQALERYAFLLPALAVIMLAVGFPIIFNFRLSMTDTRLLSGDKLGPFVGLDNYIAIFRMASFWTSLRVTIVFTGITVAGAFTIGLAVALLLNAIGNRRGWMMTVMLIPWVISPVIAAYTWRFLFNDDFGLVNEFLMNLGLIDTRIAWLAKPETTIAVIVTTAVWRLVPYMVVMLVAGLQSIPKELYEAASVDGAGVVAKLVHVTLPQLRYIIAVVIMFATIWTFNDFTIPYVMTAGAGTSSTRTLPILAYQTAFDFLRLGRASAMSTVILAVLGVLSAIYVAILLQDENDQKDVRGSWIRRLISGRRRQ
jgi:ABC-type sugar transport system permease subunit